jgi:hypothetical protein
MPRRAEIKTGKSGALHVAIHEQLTMLAKHSIATWKLAPRGATLKAHRLTEKGSKAAYLKGARRTGCKDGTQRPQGGMGMSSGKLVSSIFQPELLRLPVRAGLTYAGAIA